MNLLTGAAPTHVKVVLTERGQNRAPHERPQHPQNHDRAEQVGRHQDQQHGQEPRNAIEHGPRVSAHDIARHLKLQLSAGLVGKVAFVLAGITAAVSLAALSLVVYR